MMKLFPRTGRVLLLLAFPFLAQAQNVGIGTTAPNASAALDVVSNNKGALLPRLTTAQRAAIANPATGLMVFQTDGTPGYYYNAGTPAAPSWQQLNVVGGVGDNLGNHTATQALNLGTNALTGVGSSIGTAVGLGVRADGGLNIGQNTTGNSIYLGSSAGRVNAGASNLFIGFQSGYSNTTGSNNVLVGYNSGFSNTTGSNITALGYNSGSLSSGLTNATGLGANVGLTQSNTVILGNGANVGIGTTTPGYALQVGNATTTSAFGMLQGAFGQTSYLRHSRLLFNDANFGIGAGNMSTTPTDADMYFYAYDGVDRDFRFMHVANGLSDPSAGGWTTDLIIKQGGNVGIGTITPTATLDVNGTVRVAGGTPAAGKFLKAVDATGAAVWDFAAGAPGPTGPAGPQGAVGATGPAGASGPIGATGAQGAQGIAGSTGPAGPVGVTGATGTQGATGPIGPAGPTGATGAQGPQGIAGTDGTGPSDNLGNHTAQRNLNLAGFLLVGGTPSTPGTSGVLVAPNGNVGIGTAAPSQKLEVNGGIKFNGTGNALTFPDGTTQATAAGPIIGDIKQGLQTADHAGWLRLDGRPISTLTPTQQARATALGMGLDLPNATDKVLKQSSSTVLLNIGGSNTTFIGQNNLPNISLYGTAYSSGGHGHSFSIVGDNASISTMGTQYGLTRINYGGNPFASSFTTSTAGAHTHTVEVSLGGSNQAFYVEDAYLSVNQFVYLGQ